MRRFAGVLGGVLATSALACGGAATKPREASPPAKPAPYVHVVADPEAGRALLAPVAARAAAAGAGPLVLLGGGIGTEGDRVGAFVEAPQEGCVLAVAEGSATLQDLDLFVFADDGAILASDEASTSSAAVLVCPPHPGRLYVSARVMSGAGLFAVGSAPVSPADAPSAARAVGARGQGDETGKLDSWPGLEAKLRERRRGLGSRWEDMRRVIAPLDPRAPTRVGLTLEAGRCVDAFIVPSEEVASVDLVVEADGGRIVARGQPSGRDRGVVLCSDVHETISLALRPRGAQGAAAVIIGRTARGAEPEIARSVRIDRLTQPLELDAALKALGRSLEGSWPSPSSVGRGRALVGSRTAHVVKLEKGCSRLDVVAGRPLGSSLASLWDETTGELLAESIGTLGGALRICGPARTVRVDLEARSRPGPYAVELRRDRAAPAALVAHPVASARLLARLLGAEGDPRGAAAAEGALVASLDEARISRVPLRLEAGACFEVLAALDGGAASGLELRVIESGATTSPVVRGRHLVSDRFCTGADATRVIELRLGHGRADALVLVRPLGEGE